MVSGSAADHRSSLPSRSRLAWTGVTPEETHHVVCEVLETSLDSEA